MLNLSSNAIFVCTTFVDMRKSIDGLAIIVSGFKKDASFKSEEEGTFVFFNKKRDKIKILIRENNGFVLLYKRLDKGSFKIIFDNSKSSLSLTQRELRWLLDGLDYKQLPPLKKTLYSYHF